MSTVVPLLEAPMLGALWVLGRESFLCKQGVQLLLLKNICAETLQNYKEELFQIKRIVCQYVELTLSI